MKFIILCCLVGAALAFWEPKPLSGNPDNIDWLCERDSDCASLCKVTCNKWQYNGQQLCRRGICFCRIHATKKT